MKLIWYNQIKPFQPVILQPVLEGFSNMMTTKKLRYNLYFHINLNNLLGFYNRVFKLLKEMYN